MTQVVYFSMIFVEVVLIAGDLGRQRVWLITERTQAKRLIVALIWVAKGSKLNLMYFFLLFRDFLFFCVRVEGKCWLLTFQSLFYVGAHENGRWLFRFLNCGWGSHLGWLNETIEVWMVELSVIKELAGNIAFIGLSSLPVTTIGSRYRLTSFLNRYHHFRHGFFMLWRFLLIMRGYFVVIFIVVHKGHEYFFGILLIYENVGFDKFNAPVVNTNLDREVVTEEVQQILSLYVWV